MCTQSPSKSTPKRRTYKRVDFNYMVIVDIYIKSLERMLMRTGWSTKKPYVPVNFSLPIGEPTSLPIPKVTSSLAN